MASLRLSLVLAATLAAPAFCDDPRYSVNIQADPSILANGSLAYADILDVSGLNINKLLAKAPAKVTVQKVPGRDEVSFTRSWDGESGLSSMVGALPTAAFPTMVSFSLLPQPAVPVPLPLALTLGNARFDQWMLQAENGVSATETARFTYSTKSVAPQ